MRCNFCHEENPEGSRFCQFCGKQLTPAEKAPKAEGPAARRDATVVYPAAEEQTLARPGARPTAARPDATVLYPAEEQPASRPASGATAVRPAAGLGVLVARGGPLLGQEFPLTSGGLTVGRSPSNKVILKDSEMSRLHAIVEVGSGGRAVLTDLNSANGTFVNGERITKRELKSGDQVVFGTSGENRFQFLLPHAMAAESRPAAGTLAAVEGTMMMPSTGMPEAPGELGTMLLQQETLPQAHLQLVIDQYNVRNIELPPEGLVLGRDSARAQYAAEFNHPSVSGTHVELRWQDSEVMLRDLNSTNGTFVNGRRVAQRILQEADFICLGQHRDRALIFRSGKRRGLTVRDISLDRPLLRIGRDPQNEIHLDHPAISRFHGELRKEGDHYVLTDLGSTNGIFVNGQRITRHMLHPEDTISIGPVQLRFDGFAIEQQSDGSEVRVDVFHVSKRVGGAAGRVVLDDVSLAISPRAFVGLLGPSGCGKTTFLDAVSGLRPASDGSVLINRMNLYQFAQSFRTSMGYVPQEDIMHRQLTVEECLRFAAGLRLPGDTSPAELKARVDEVIEQVGLEERRQMPISLLSGGQRKRVSIAIEILSKPSILFLDEPTAGLDPHTEVQIMQLFRELANQGATLLTTTHVLGSFSLFDNVVIMVAGKLAFYGPPNQLLKYFQVETPYNIYGKLIEEKKPAEWKQQFEQSPVYGDIARQLQGVAERTSTPAAATGQQQHRGEGWRQFRLLSSRYLAIKMKDKMQVGFLLLQAPLIAFLVSFLSTTPNAPGTLFMLMFAALWFGCANAVREIADEQNIYRRERQTGLSIPAYLFSKVAVLGGFGAIQAFLLVTVLTLLNTHPSLGGLEGNFYSATLLTFLLTLNGTLIGLFLSSLFNTSEKALAWFPLILIPQLLLAGLFVPAKKIERIIPLTNQQVAEQVAAHMQVELPPRLAEVLEGSGFGRRVRGALVVGDEAAGRLREFIGGGSGGMGTALQVLSSLCASRWGLEALADLYVHGDHASQNYAYQLINSVAISLPRHYPEDARFLRDRVAVTSGPGAPRQNLFQQQWDYLALLGGFLVGMTGLIALMLKRKDKPVV